MLTTRDYISQKMSAFGRISEAELLDMAVVGQFSLDETYSEENAKKIGVALASFIEERALAPRVSSMSESGFSMSWDYSGLGKYYLWLCRKWGVTPNADALSMLGFSAIIDRSDIW